MSVEAIRWFEPPESAHEKNVDRIETVNEALAEGKAVTLLYDHEHESRATVVYHDRNNDLLLWSPHVDEEGGRRVYGITPGEATEQPFAAQVIIVALADERRIEPVEETPLYHSTYGVRDPQDI